MPAIEAIGLTLGILGVASLYSTALDAIDRFSAAKSYGEDYQLFVTKANIERLRLFRWGQAVGLVRVGGSPQQHDSRIQQQHKLLQDPAVQGAVCELLAWAVCFFGDAEGVKKRHGVRGSKSTRGFITQSSSTMTSTTRAMAFNHIFPRGRAGKMQKDASALSKMKWVFSGKRRSEKLLQELSWFVDKLHELVPIPTAHLYGGALLETPAPVRISTIYPTAILTTGTPLGVSEPLPPSLNLGSRRSHMKHGKLVSSVRRAQKNRIRRIAAGAAADRQLRAAEADKQVAKIRVDERYAVIFFYSCPASCCSVVGENRLKSKLLTDM